MPRELHPELFGEQIMAQASEKLNIDPLEALRRKVRGLESGLQTLTARVDKLSLNLEQRAAELKEKLEITQSALDISLKDFKQNLATMQERVRTQEQGESQIQDLLDRHNVLVQQFEQRMQGLQKITSDQEYKLFTYNNTLSEILKEIRNLR